MVWVSFAFIGPKYLENNVRTGVGTGAVVVRLKSDPLAAFTFRAQRGARNVKAARGSDMNRTRAGLTHAAAIWVSRPALNPPRHKNTPAARQTESDPAPTTLVDAWIHVRVIFWCLFPRLPISSSAKQYIHQGYFTPLARGETMSFRLTPGRLVN